MGLALVRSPVKAAARSTHRYRSFMTFAMRVNVSQGDVETQTSLAQLRQREVVGTYDT